MTFVAYAIETASGTDLGAARCVEEVDRELAEHCLKTWPSRLGSYNNLSPSDIVDLYFDDQEKNGLGDEWLSISWFNPQNIPSSNTNDVFIAVVDDGIDKKILADISETGLFQQIGRICLPENEILNLNGTDMKAAVEKHFSTLAHTRPKPDWFSIAKINLGEEQQLNMEI